MNNYNIPHNDLATPWSEKLNQYKLCAGLSDNMITNKEALLAGYIDAETYLRWETVDGYWHDDLPMGASHDGIPDKGPSDTDD